MSAIRFAEFFSQGKWYSVDDGCRALSPTTSLTFLAMSSFSATIVERESVLCTRTDFEADSSKDFENSNVGICARAA